MTERFDQARAVAVLERTPSVLRQQLAGLPDLWVHGREAESSWSPFEVVGHLINGERTDWIPRARLILERGEAATFEPFDRFAHLAEFPGRPLEELLGLFATLRRQNLDTLAGWKLGEGELDRRGRHPDFGPVTLRELLATWVVHDLGHLAQISRVMAKQYAGLVGPWEAYLPVLHDRR
jgi:DinB family protein